MATEGRPSTHIHLPDWLLHISAYTVLTVLAWIACHGAFPSRNILHHRFCAAGISGGFGMLDELLQRTTSLRCSDPIDLAADVAGAVIGFVIIMLYSHFGKETFPS
ncbi:VanZ family protein [bacterium]|nr:VanZ family protein [candidate division CSSED10-310 bacterium]